MPTFPIVCDGPGPHSPADGVVGQSSAPGVTGMRCAATPCQPTADTATVNRQTLQQRAQSYISAAQTYQALASPTTAQTAAMVKTNTKAITALVRLVIGQLDDTSGT